MSKHKFYYCQYNIENSNKCKIQCSHCKLFFKPLENDMKRIPRKMKKVTQEQIEAAAAYLNTATGKESLSWEEGFLKCAEWLRGKKQK